MFKISYVFRFFCHMPPEALDVTEHNIAIILDYFYHLIHIIDLLSEI